MKRYSFLLVLLITNIIGFAQVTVSINSGNPNFPFPQFLEYAYGASHSLGNIGTRNAEGVVHAEMEQDIRDAYQIYANEFAYTGESWAGIKYIETPYKAAYDCTEGDGYALLAAAYMADKTTFDGYWMCTHDKRRNKTKRYKDCVAIAPNYEYGPYALGDNGPGGNTAADGDVDVALALYVAWMQWGDYMRDANGNIIHDACGEAISYKKEMTEIIRGLVAKSTRFGNDPNDNRYNSGMIGFDGYPKGGDTWGEQTNWATVNQPGGLKPEFGGPTQQHIDYNAPAYYHQFYKLLESLNGDPWEIEQFRRGEASSDWLMKQLIDKNNKAIPTAGWVDVAANNNTTFTNFNQGEDFRCSWRTISNYMWHGNPTYSWNPTTHQVVDNTPNTYEYEAGLRMAAFLEDPARWNPAAGSKCITYGDPAIPYGGPSTLNIQYNPMTGVTLSDFFVLNWQHGTGSFSAVAAQNYELMGLTWRQCVIEWDNNGKIPGAGVDDCYLGTKPNYFHGWMRQLGMMVVSGNYHAPSEMVPRANMKIYRAIEDSVTFCYTGDQIKFLLDYRNYGSVDANDVKIVEQVPNDFIFLSASNGGVYDPSTHTVTWNIGTVKGFKTGGLAATKGQVSYTLKAGNNASGRYCTTADITCSNGLGWTSNEYPNYITPTMQRNCVDVISRALIIEKSVDRKKANEGNLVTFSIDFENSAEVGWLDGGRPRVNVAFANGRDGARLQLMFRLFNDAIEPYINYGNYRISYYLSDAGLNCYAGAAGCNVGWGLMNEIYEGGDRTQVTVTHENIVQGSDAFGKWNQRLCVQFAPLLVANTMHVSRYFGGANCRVHKGGSSPFRGVWALYPSDYSTGVDWTDDWSWGSYGDDKGGLYYPITPSWQKLDANGQSIEEPVKKWLTCGCTESSKTISNILVEEYDGYVWRRVLGTGPMPGRDIVNVVIKDTLPHGLTFDAFLNSCPLADFQASWNVTKTSDNRDIITWTIPKLQVKQKGTIKYSATVTFPSKAHCQTPDETIINAAWIQGYKESPVSDTVSLTVTCADLPVVIEPTTLIKKADKSIYSVGDNITYTIEYEQTHGSIIKNATEKSSDWTLQNYSISGGKLNANTYAFPNSAVFNGGIGKNVYLEYVCAPDTYVTHQVLLRQGSANPITLQIKSLNTSQMEVTGYVNGTIVSPMQSLTFGGGTPYTIRIDLQNGLLRLWVNKDTTNSPIFTMTNLPVGEGKIGFKNGDMTQGDAGGHTFSNIYAHFDYAYDLVITDPIPTGITFTSASNSGNNNNGVITWNLDAGPIPFGKKYTITWTGKVNSCNTFIENIAYANLRGHLTNSIAAQSVVDCGASTCPDPPIVTSPIRYCKDATGAQKLSATGSNLKWYTAATGGSGSTTAPTPSTSTVTTLNYWVTQTVSGCESGRSQIQVIIDPLPTVSINPNSAETCSGTSLSLTGGATGGSAPYTTHAWTGTGASYLNNTNTPSPSFTTTVTTTQTYTLTYTATDSRGCKASINKDIKVHALPTVTLSAQPTEICKGTTSTITATVSPTATGGVGTWTGATKVTETTATFSGATTSNVSYSFTTAENCTTESASSISITVHPAPDAPEVEDVHYCQNAIPTPLTAIGNNLLWYTGATGGSGSTTAPTPNTSSATTLHYWVSQTVNDCESERSQITVTIHALPTAILTATPSEICSGSNSIISAAVTPSATGGTGTWTGATKNTETSATFSGTSTTIISYSFKDAHGCTMASPATTSVTVHSMPATPTVADLQYCKGATLIPALTAGGSDLKWYTSATDDTGTPTAPIPSTNEVEEQEYWVSQTVHGCESERAKITVTILDKLEPTITASSDELCADKSITLGISGGVFSSRTWSGTAAAYLNSTSVAAPTFSGADAGTYTIELLVTDANGCEGTASKTIEVYALPTAILTATPSEICSGGSSPISAVVTPSATGGTGTWTGATKNTETTATFSGTSTTTISYSFTNAHGCAMASPATTSVTVHPIPAAPT
ncbi:MAG: hypothetical protein GX277_08975, partial [Bacteroidales bacterium]|nr:hypothetical protein [Bacteroidales bacterium]